MIEAFVEEAEGFISLDLDEEDAEVVRILTQKEEYPSLGQRERDLELYETAPQQVWKSSKIFTHY